MIIRSREIVSFDIIEQLMSSDVLCFLNDLFGVGFPAQLFLFNCNKGSYGHYTVVHLGERKGEGVSAAEE